LNQKLELTLIASVVFVVVVTFRHSVQKSE
jgi:hypothetical protein